MSEKLLVFNGINGATGDYGLPPMTGAELAAVGERARVPRPLLEHLARARVEQAERRRERRRVAPCLLHRP